jgi:hypothetical protein
MEHPANNLFLVFISFIGSAGTNLKVNEKLLACGMVVIVGERHIN